MGRMKRRQKRKYNLKTKVEALPTETSSTTAPLPSEASMKDKVNWVCSLLSNQAFLGEFSKKFEKAVVITEGAQTSIRIPSTKVKGRTKRDQIIVLDNQNPNQQMLSIEYEIELNNVPIKYYAAIKYINGEYVQEQFTLMNTEQGFASASSTNEIAPDDKQSMLDEFEDLISSLSKMLQNKEQTPTSSLEVKTEIAEEPLLSQAPSSMEDKLTKMFKEQLKETLESFTNLHQLLSKKDGDLKKIKAALIAEFRRFKFTEIQGVELPDIQVEHDDNTIRVIVSFTDNFIDKSSGQELGRKNVHEILFHSPTNYTFSTKKVSPSQNITTIEVAVKDNEVELAHRISSQREKKEETYKEDDDKAFGLFSSILRDFQFLQEVVAPINQEQKADTTESHLINTRPFQALYTNLAKDAAHVEQIKAKFMQKFNGPVELYNLANNFMMIFKFNEGPNSHQYGISFEDQNNFVVTHMANNPPVHFTYTGFTVKNGKVVDKEFSSYERGKKSKNDSPISMTREINAIQTVCNSLIEAMAEESKVEIKAEDSSSKVPQHGKPSPTNSFNAISRQLSGLLTVQNQIQKDIEAFRIKVGMPRTPIPFESKLAPINEVKPLSSRTMKAPNDQGDKEVDEAKELFVENYMPKRGCLMFFRPGGQAHKMELEQIIRHSLKPQPFGKNRSRTVCEELGWITEDGKRGNKAPSVVANLITKIQAEEPKPEPKNDWWNRPRS